MALERLDSLRSSGSSKISMNPELSPEAPGGLVTGWWMVVFFDEP